ncbi:hypothetical protein GGTG_08115 [Gaeumannomyces tritici R3-111a-1]|uniref:Vitamin H transporter n=1 Tax=Gaeumannomyces tritici (strain R3-111a-1) TaxID=644352 RepID=J3P3M8_GAET3|nr:hypothetical protein GGTG_08115 [Gaeumannomyces tritici R3-111a-1]EJT74272.1 hypothetical protein GGTG_08115 [Gaeumannomyces tritici R3-111a-1]
MASPNSKQTASPATVEAKAPRPKMSWYSPDDSPEERRFIAKLDLILIPYVFLAYAIKAIDGANLNNAYVAGMKEDLGFFGNQLVQIQTFYTIGAVAGMLPFIYFFTSLPMHWSIPFMDIMRALFTLCQCRANSFAELAAYRFLVGFFESPFYPAMSFILGSWYRGNEMARRGGISSTGVNIGNLAAGLIASSASKYLEGHLDITGWRWNYIICGLMTFPVAVMGFFLLPGTAAKPNLWILSAEEVKIGQERLERDGHRIQGTFHMASLPKILGNFRFWIVVFVNVLFWNAGIHKGTGGYLLWIKSLGRFDAAQINQLGSMAPALGILYTLAASFASDLFLGPTWTITITAALNASGLVILTIWFVPEGALWYAFSTMFWSSAIAGVLSGWINALLRDSPEERSFTLIMVTIIAQLTTAGTPLLTFQTVEGPRYPKGYAFVLACALTLIASVHVLNIYLKREDAQRAAVPTDEEKMIQARIDAIERPDTANSLAKPAAMHLEKEKRGGDGKMVPRIVTSDLRSSRSSSWRNSWNSDFLTLPHIKPVDPFSPI